MGGILRGWDGDSEAAATRKNSADGDDSRPCSTLRFFGDVQTREGGQTI